MVVVDANGAKTIILLRSNTGAATIMADVIACSQADFLNWWESAVTVNGAPAPAGGAYRGVQQRAALSFLCADNTVAVVIVPCPSLSIFLADQETVDPTAAPVAALIAACIGQLESSTGSLATAFLAGSLQPGTRSPL